MPHAVSPEPSALPNDTALPNAQPLPTEQHETSQESEQTDGEISRAPPFAAIDDGVLEEKTRLEDMFDDDDDDENFPSSNDAPLWVNNAIWQVHHLTNLQNTFAFCKVLRSRSHESILSATFPVQVPFSMVESLGFSYQRFRKSGIRIHTSWRRLPALPILHHGRSVSSYHNISGCSR